MQHDTPVHSCLLVDLDEETQSRVKIHDEMEKVQYISSLLILSKGKTRQQSSSLKTKSQAILITEITGTILCLEVYGWAQRGRKKSIKLRKSQFEAQIVLLIHWSLCNPTRKWSFFRSNFDVQTLAMHTKIQ